MNQTTTTYPCSCEDRGQEHSPLVKKGFCKDTSSNKTQSGNSPEDWPVYQKVCGGLWGQGLGSGTPRVRVL